MTYAVLIVEINRIHLKITQRIFTALAHVLRLSGYNPAIPLKGDTKPGAYEHLGTERGILEELPKKPLILSLRYCLVHRLCEE
jgi:hypothetical protein